MLYVGEAFGRLPANPLCWRIGRYQLGVLPLQQTKLLHQCVILGVADLGLIQYEVKIIVPGELISKELCPFAWSWFGHAFSTREYADGCVANVRTTACHLNCGRFYLTV